MADVAGDKIAATYTHHSAKRDITTKERGEVVEWVASVEVVAIDTALRVTNGVFEVTGARVRRWAWIDSGGMSERIRGMILWRTRSRSWEDMWSRESRPSSRGIHELRKTAWLDVKVAELYEFMIQATADIESKIYYPHKTHSHDANLGLYETYCLVDLWPAAQKASRPFVVKDLCFYSTDPPLLVVRPCGCFDHLSPQSDMVFHSLLMIRQTMIVGNRSNACSEAHVSAPGKFHQLPKGYCFSFLLM